MTPDSGNRPQPHNHRSVEGTPFPLPFGNVTGPVRAQIDVAGSLPFPFGQFGMTAPNIAGLMTVQSNPTLEFRVVLQHW
jgi:hypothetical protein